MLTVPFALPDITSTEIDEVVAALKSGWITTGPRAHRLEAEFAQRVGSKHALGVNSCTAALHLALEAVGVKPADEVIIPSMTFAATGEVVRYLGAHPRLVDIRRDDHCLDVEAVERAITPRTRAIIPVHFAGQACDMGPLLDLARRHGLFVVEDAAHAFPAALSGKPVGSIGDITCFSFYATKTITTAEGGMAVTNRDDWADRMRIMSLHGISKDAWKRYTAEGSWYYEITDAGFKYNLSDMAAALGLAQLSRATAMLERRREIARCYLESLQTNGALDLLEFRNFDDHAWHLFVIKLRRGALGIDRAQFIRELHKRGVGASVHFIPLHMHPYYRSRYGHAPNDFPVALECYNRSISLPIYSKMTDEQVSRVVEAVSEITRLHTC